MAGVLRDVLSSIRSKNAGPFTLTIDLFLPDRATFDDLVGRSVVTPELVAALYGLPVEDVRVFPFPPALAIKISIPRPLPGGSPGDRDVAGGQQFAPLLDVPI